MAHRTLLKRIAKLLACTLLFTQLVIAAHACPALGAMSAAAPAAAATDGKAAVAAMPACHEPMGTPDSSPSNLCTEHCKQGQQSDRAGLSVVLPPALLNALYETPAPAEPAPRSWRTPAWLSALVAASPPHAIAHCVLRI